MGVLAKQCKDPETWGSWVNEIDSADPTVQNRKSEYGISSICIRSRSIESVRTSAVTQGSVSTGNVSLAFKLQHVASHHNRSPGKKIYINPYCFSLCYLVVVCVAHAASPSSRPYHTVGFSVLFPDSARRGCLPQIKHGNSRLTSSRTWLRVLWAMRTDTSEGLATSSTETQVACSSETSFTYRTTQVNIPDGPQNLR